MICCGDEIDGCGGGWCGSKGHLNGVGMVGLERRLRERESERDRKRQWEREWKTEVEG